MKILQVCNKPPYPPVDGGVIAMNNITQGLLKHGHNVKVVSICTAKHPVNSNSIPQDYIEKTQFESVFIDTSIKVSDAFFNLFSNKSYNVERFISEDFGNKLKEILQKNQFDIVLIESIFVAPYIDLIKEFSSAKIVLRAHNVEHLIWERIRDNCTNLLKKKYLDFLSKRLKNYEFEVLNKIDALCAMTDIDENKFVEMGFKKDLITIPTGYILDTPEEDNVKIEGKSIFHIASMNWTPNIEAVKWFIDNVWELVLDQNPDAKLYLAGREMPEDFFNLNIKGIEVVGEVESARDFYLSKEIMIVPLLSGGGMRIKIIEGMSLGKVIISTSIGAEGIKCKNNENILIANTPAEFADKINLCLNDNEFCKNISVNAKKLIEEKYDNHTICKKMANFFENLIAKEVV